MLDTFHKTKIDRYSGKNEYDFTANEIVQAISTVKIDVCIYLSEFLVKIYTHSYEPYLKFWIPRCRALHRYLFESLRMTPINFETTEQISFSLVDKFADMPLMQQQPPLHWRKYFDTSLHLSHLLLSPFLHVNR